MSSHSYPEVSGVVAGPSWWVANVIEVATSEVMVVDMLHWCGVMGLSVWGVELWLIVLDGLTSEVTPDKADNPFAEAVVANEYL